MSDSTVQRALLTEVGLSTTASLQADLSPNSPFSPSILIQQVIFDLLPPAFVPIIAHPLSFRKILRLTGESMSLQVMGWFGVLQTNSGLVYLTIFIRIFYIIEWIQFHEHETKATFLLCSCTLH